MTITFGLLFMRSSVDHGTAFDIAGTGKAGTVSMLSHNGRGELLEMKNH